LISIEYIQAICRETYDTAYKRLHIDDYKLYPGEFYYRDIKQIVKTNSLTDASTFMRVLVGAFYIANNKQIIQLPAEIKKYLEELKSERNLQQSISDICEDAAKGLNDFIHAPDHYPCGELEKEILISALRDPALTTANIRFFAQPNAIDHDKNNKTTEPERKQPRYG
jgi:hypothetical protein